MSSGNRASYIVWTESITIGMDLAFDRQFDKQLRELGDQVSQAKTR